MAAALAGPAAPAAVTPEPLRYEAEAWSEPKSAWIENKDTPDHWNLWSKDKDAESKWSKGVVLRAPAALKTRNTPEEGAPPLHTRITGIPAGTFDVSVKIVRTLGVSLDGRTWQPFKGGLLAEGVVITNGVFELWVDDRYADERSPGTGYYDYVELTRVPERVVKPLVQGFAKERVREKLDRGVVALRMDAEVYVGWRLLVEDPGDLAFHVYRTVPGQAPERVTAVPVTRTTDFVDRTAPQAEGLRYGVRPVRGGVEGPEQGSAIVPATVGNCLRFKLEPGATFQKVGIGDLDGDGRYDMVIKLPNYNIDPADEYWKPSTNTYKLEARRSDGSLLWRKDLGWAIEMGIWYSPFIVFDLDGDGRAEVAAKIGEGDPRDPDGRVRSGPEWLVVWDGTTGKEKGRVPWPDRSGFGEGKRQYNYASRNQLAVAYLDGKTPAILALRGTYNTMKVDAYELGPNGLRSLWTFRDAEGGKKYSGQGCHFTHTMDVDGDGRDEVILGSSVLDDNGSPLWTTGLGHPDHMYVGNLDPSRSGLQIFYGVETAHQSNGMCMVEAATGKILWGWNKPTTHIHSFGMCADMDPAVPGAEAYAADCTNHIPTGDRWLWSAKGEVLSRDVNFGFGQKTVYWDADLQREILYQGRNIRDLYSVLVQQEIEGTVVMVADVLGDWREELIVSTPGELRIYTTAIPAMDRRPTFMQDPAYRQTVAMGAMGYTLVPLPSYALDARAPNLNVTVLAEGVVQTVVSAPKDKPLKGRVALSTAQGTVEPAEFSVEVAAGGLAVFKSRLTPVPTRGQTVAVTGTLEAGEVQRRLVARGVVNEKGR